MMTALRHKRRSMYDICEAEQKKLNKHRARKERWLSISAAPRSLRERVGCSGAGGGGGGVVDVVSSSPVAHRETRPTWILQDEINRSCHRHDSGAHLPRPLLTNPQQPRSE